MALVVLFITEAIHLVVHNLLPVPLQSLLGFWFLTPTGPALPFLVCVAVRVPNLSRRNTLIGRVCGARPGPSRLQMVAPFASQCSCSYGGACRHVVSRPLCGNFFTPTVRPGISLPSS